MERYSDMFLLVVDVWPIEMTVECGSEAISRISDIDLALFSANSSCLLMIFLAYDYLSRYYGYPEVIRYLKVNKGNKN